MEKGWRKEEGGIKMKKQDDGIKMKREFRSKVDDKVVLDTKKKVESTLKKGKVDDYKSENWDETKTREAVTMRMKEKQDDKVRGKVEIQTTEAMIHEIKDDHLENRIQEKVGAHTKMRDGHKMSREVGIEATEKDGIKYMENVGIGKKQKVDDKLKDKFEIKMKEGVGNLSEKVDNKIKDESGIKIREEIVNNTQKVIGTNTKGIDTSYTGKIGRTTGTEVKGEVEDRMKVKSGIDVKEEIGYGLEEKVSGTVRKHGGSYRIDEEGIRMNRNIENNTITREVNKEIVGNVRLQSELEKKRESGQESEKKIQHHGTRKREDEGIKTKGNLENKIIRRDVNKEIVDNAKVPAELKKKRENGQDSKEKDGSVMQKGVRSHRKEEDGIKMKRVVENKTVIKDVNKELVGNMMVQSGLVKKREYGQDVAEKDASMMQKNNTYRMEQEGIEMKGGVENKTVTKDINREIIGNMRVLSGFEKERKGGQDSKEKDGSIMQKAVGTHRNEQDGIKMKGDVEIKTITRDSNKEILGNMGLQPGLEKKSDIGQYSKIKVDHMKQKDVTHRKEEEVIKETLNFENKIIRRDVNKEMVDNAKVHSELERKRENGQDSKEKVVSIMQKDVGIHRKEEDGIKMKRDVENKTIIRDVNKELVGDVKIQSGIVKKREYVQEVTEKDDSIMQKDAATRRKGEDEIKMKKDKSKEIVQNVKVQSGFDKKKEIGPVSKDKHGSTNQMDNTYRKEQEGIKMKVDVENKTVTRDLNREIVDNVKVRSGFPKENDSGQDSKEKHGNILQKAVYTHRNEQDGIKMKGDGEMKTIVRDINTDILANVRLQSVLEKKSDIGQDSKGKIDSVKQKDVTHKKDEEGIMGNVENKTTRRDLNKEIVDIAKIRPGFEKKNGGDGQHFKEKVLSIMQKNVETHRKEDEGVKMKRHIENKMITRDVKKEIVDNVKLHSRLEKNGEHGHDSKEKVKGVMHKDVGPHRKMGDGIKMKGDVHDKTIRRDANKEIVGNMKVQSKLEKHDLKEKIKSPMQKDVGTHRKGEDGIKIKEDIENKIITKDVNKLIIDNVKVHSRHEKKKENGYDLREKARSTMQKDVVTHKKEEDEIKTKSGVQNKVTLEDENKEVEDTVRETSVENDGFAMMGRAEYSMKEENENQFKEEKQNDSKDVINDEIREKREIEIKINDGVTNTTKDKIGNKKKGEVEKSRTRDFVDSIKEKLKNVLRDESGISEKEKDAVKSTMVDERFNIKEETGKLMSKRSEIMKEGEMVNDRKEKVGHKLKGSRDKIEGKSENKGKVEIKGGIREKVDDKTKDKGRKDKVEDTMRARHVIRMDEKNEIKMKKDVEHKKKEKVMFKKEKEVEHNIKDNGRMKIKGKVENTLIERAHSIKEKDTENKMKAKVEHKTRGEVVTKLKEKDERHGIRMREEVGHKTKKNVAFKKEEKIGIKMKGEAKIRKEKQ